ncbi:hypothetical protein H5T88_05150 [bacterium]|nr:hypothetical protein [bacterium]
MKRNNPIHNSFYFDGDDLIIEAQGSSILAYYTQGQGLLSQRRNNASYFYHYDGLGSAKVLTDANQNIQNTTIYDAWGNVLQSSGTITNSYLYVGEHGYCFDQDINLTLTGERFLNISHGTFLTRDPARFNARNSSLYSYSDASPVNYIDPTGRATCWIGYTYFKKYCLWYDRKTGKLDKITQGSESVHHDWCAEARCIPKFLLFDYTYKGTARYEDGLWYLPPPSIPLINWHLPSVIVVPWLPAPVSPSYDRKKWRLSCTIDFQLTVKLFWCCKQKDKE